MVPIDHVLLRPRPRCRRSSSSASPAASLHFVVAWRRHGPLVQVMDPATGRRWPRARSVPATSSTSTRMPVPAAALARVGGDSELFRSGMRARAWRARRPAATRIDAVLSRRVERPSWRSSRRSTRARGWSARSSRRAGCPRRRRARRCATIWARACEADDPAARRARRLLVGRARPDGPTAARRSVLVRGAVLVRVSRRARRPTRAAERAARCRAKLVAALAGAAADPVRDLLAPAARRRRARAGRAARRRCSSPRVGRRRRGPAVPRPARPRRASSALAGAAAGRDGGARRASRRCCSPSSCRSRRRLLAPRPPPRSAAARRVPREDPAPGATATSRAGRSPTWPSAATRVHQSAQLPDARRAARARSTFELLADDGRHRAGSTRRARRRRSLAAAAAVGVPLLAQPSLRERDLRLRTHTRRAQPLLPRRAARPGAGPRARRRARAAARARERCSSSGRARARARCAPP